ncbi:MAG: acetylornithine/succinylornithine family transaminase [Candidatus Sumerlaeota bacterium]|nr:acetylornithine/succinylornithine family transaminase [Candidatus Sumerlaeota bacterium]
MNTIELEEKYTSGVYAKRPLVVVRGQGAHIWDENGREYIDCIAGIGVASVGHCHPRVVAALKDQAERIITVPELFYSDVRARLMEKLAAISPQGVNRFFLANSGTEAVEGAMKFARLTTKRTDFIAFQRGFHGRTMGALTATHKKDYRDPFQPLLQGMTHVPADDIEALKAAVTDRTAAIIFEPVQGEGGVRVMNMEFVRAMAAYARERGVLLIADEIQCGMGRTGKWFACEHFGVTPDLVCMAKALGGGVPIGAIGLSEKIVVEPKSVHGSTFGGNPLSAAAAIASIEAMQEEKMVEMARDKGAWFMDKLRAIGSPKIREVRGLGLMVGVELKGKVQKPLQMLQEKHGVCALLAGPTVMRFLPPFVISYEDLERVVEAVKAVLLSEAEE